MASSNDNTASAEPIYPMPCGWCHWPVLSEEGWLVHGHGVCLLLQWLGRELTRPPRCLVTVSPDVYEWLTA